MMGFYLDAAGFFKKDNCHFVSVSPVWVSGGYPTPLDNSENIQFFLSSLSYCAYLAKDFAACFMFGNSTIKTSLK